MKPICFRPQSRFLADRLRLWPSQVMARVPTLRAKVTWSNSIMAAISRWIWRLGGRYSSKESFKERAR